MDKISILMESLRRTDSYSVAADQKASFTLAAGIAYLGIYASIFYNIISDKEVNLPISFSISVIGLVIVVWVKWFSIIRKVFDPDTTKAQRKSVVSFVSIIKNDKSLDELIDTYTQIEEQDQRVNNLTRLECDLLENHWICSKICLNKMENFKSSLNWLLLALGTSVLGLALIAFYLNFLAT
ncbi:hypothetical protein ABO242_002052 [Vibrio parahaemolyticus]|uniref:hypothetical protein n=1 Tax=Vibrio parahaemolyticus TaxID=670 RepID=UPI0006A65C29|nr:hypothetical protein [Vibrio parahaemolyticus]EHK0041050.1 hypothetical protein [Vibrio parahaemolyticus]KOE93530.1 hypothetical protein ACS88_18440 [Vibrio parahaemolyticus]